jgi:hypothetical protein
VVNQPAVTVDISRHGARVSGVKAWDYPGDTIGLRYGGDKCRYRIVWVGAVGTRIDGEIGLMAVDPGKYLWDAELAQANVLRNPPTGKRAATDQSGNPLVERKYADPRRREQRFAISGGASVKEEGKQVSLWATLSDLSMGGCYLETLAPLAVDTIVEVTLQVDQIKIDTRAIVASKHPLMGMGMKFLEMSPINRDRLHHLLGSLERSLLDGKGY